MGPFTLLKLQPLSALFAFLLLCSCQRERTQTAPRKPEAAKDTCATASPCVADENISRSEILQETESSLEAFYSCRDIRIEGTAGESVAARSDSSRSADRIDDLTEGSEFPVLAWNKDGELLQHDSVPLRSSSLWYQISVGGHNAWVSAVYTRCLDNPVD
jgi:hypothetical protein